MKNFNMIISCIFIGWFVLLSSWKFKFESDRKITNIEWNGLVWVFLDWYSINQYHSDDEVMHAFNYESKDK